MELGDEVEVSVDGLGALTNTVADSGDSAADQRPRPVLPVPDRLAARRPGPHGALQLGVRAPPRRHVRLPDRGHRRGAQHRGVLRRDPRPDALARPRLGRGPRGRRPARALPAERARRHLRRRARPAARRRRTPTTASAPPTRSTPAARRPAPRCMGYDGFCRELSAEQVAAFEAEGRRPVVRFRMPDGSITWDDLVRGDITFETAARARLRALPRQRRPALHAGQPGRRRADGDHPRAARRGPAVEHAAPDRAVRRADRARHRGGARRGSVTCPT